MAVKRSDVKEIVRRAIEDNTDALTDEEVDAIADDAATMAVDELDDVYDDEDVIGENEEEQSDE